MATRIETLEANLVKLQAQLATTTAALETARMADLEAEETAKKLADAAERVRAFFVGEGIVIPTGKQLVIVQVSTNGETEYTVSIVDTTPKGKTPRAAKAAGGNGGAGKIVLADGSTTSWAAMCQGEALDPGAGSAHLYFSKQRPDMHVGIPHVCALDGKTYPLVA